LLFWIGKKANLSQGSIQIVSHIQYVELV
jgi:hypothetical protein